MAIAWMYVNRPQYGGDAGREGIHWFFVWGFGADGCLTV